METRRRLAGIILCFLGLSSIAAAGSGVPDHRELLPFFVDTTVTVDITVCHGEMYEGYSVSGTYTDTFVVDGMDSIRILHLTVLPAIKHLVRHFLCPGDSLMGYSFPWPGDQTFVDTFTAQNGCDSIRNLYILVFDECTPYVKMDLDSCQSSMSAGTHMDYSEFGHAVLDSVYCGFPNLLCFSVAAAGFSRQPGAASKHSCTPGVNFSPAMCIDANLGCEYQPGAPGALLLDYQAGIGVGTQYLTGIAFYARAPMWYSWINGPSGVNNYPQYFGLRVLENGVEVYRITDIPTTRLWQSYFFSMTKDGKPMLMKNRITIEFFAYCPVGVGGEVSAWDIDEVILHHGYYFLEGPAPVIQGIVRHREDQGVSGVEVVISKSPSFSEPVSVITDASGQYAIAAPMEAGQYYIKARKPEEVVAGISALDMVAIQKHLLGIAPFDETVDLVAADIDRSEMINVIDVLALQRYLLGLDGVYPGASPWRFGVLSGEAPHSYPEDWTEVIQVDYNGVDPLVLDFLAVKVGDCGR